MSGLDVSLTHFPMVRARTVGEVEAICDDPNGSGSLVEPVHLVGESRCRSEVLQVSIRHVCKVELLVARVHGDVVQRIKLAAPVVVQDDWQLVCPSEMHMPGLYEGHIPFVSYGATGFTW
jgi:hypothetical protein